MHAKLDLLEIRMNELDAVETFFALNRQRFAKFEKKISYRLLLPAAHTVQLLRMCDFGQSIHLQLRNYVYSFEWLVGLTSWRASVHVWNPDVYYRHGQSSDTLLLPPISEYATKMQGFSHADRIGGRLDLLDPKRIQDTICKGKDIFGMLPEAYSYVDLFSKLSLEPLTAVGLPLFLTENAERFGYYYLAETGPMVGDIG
ncbi:glycosyltransferase family 17-domain-containing protein [Mycena olivaceomarginata]|nr:glycosyltransferase family 17-domain-containing protein [Mycena olivaceomarginata]